MFAILDVAISVARMDPVAWMLLARADPAFSRWAFSKAGQDEFIALIRVTPLNITHSFFDRPATRSRTKYQWFRYGVRHRKHAPAVIYDDGREIWYNRGLIHRGCEIINGTMAPQLPAATSAGGLRMYYVNGKRHRDDFLPAIEGGSHPRWFNDGHEYRLVRNYRGKLMVYYLPN